jgi:hypothetical protein
VRGDQDKTDLQVGRKMVGSEECSPGTHEVLEALSRQAVEKEKAADDVHRTPVVPNDRIGCFCSCHGDDDPEQRLQLPASLQTIQDHEKQDQVAQHHQEVLPGEPLDLTESKP